jgi:hypothetical protein
MRHKGHGGPLCWQRALIACQALRWLLNRPRRAYANFEACMINRHEETVVDSV